MQTDSVEKAAGIGAIGLWAALPWMAWLACCSLCRLHDAGLGNRYRSCYKKWCLEFPQSKAGIVA